MRKLARAGSLGSEPVGRKRISGKPQIIIESTFGDSHPGKWSSWISWWKRYVKVLMQQADTEQDTFATDIMTVRARERTASISVWQAVR